MYDIQSETCDERIKLVDRKHYLLYAKQKRSMAYKIFLGTIIYLYQYYNDNPI